MKKEIISEKDKLEEARNISIKEGSAASFSAGITYSYLTPYALALNAQPIHIGLLSSFSGLLAPIAQIFGSKLIGKVHRKKIVLSFVLLQALSWIPIAAIALLYWKNLLTDYLLYGLIVLYSIVSIFGGLSYPAWFSWMGDIVQEKERGRYYSKRNLVTGIVEIAAVLVGLAILSTLEKSGYAILGFGILFVLAFLFRFISYVLFHQQYSPSRFKLNHKYHITTKDLLKNNKNFERFSYYQLFFNLAIMIASPFFAVYMLQDLGFSYVMYVSVAISSSIFYLLFLPLAGKFSDKYGNLKLIYLSNFLFVLSPLLWLVFKTPLTLIIFPQIISGMANAAFIIAFTNFTYSSVNPKYIGAGVAYLNVMVGIGVFIGSLIGGFILKYVNNFNFAINSFFIVFIIAALSRLLIALYFLPRIKEEKRVERIPPLHVNITHPFRSLHTEIGWLRTIYVSLNEKRAKK